MATGESRFRWIRERVTTRDEEYWEEHKATPKILMRLEDARELFASRYGSQTSYRVSLTDPSLTIDAVAAF